MATQPDNPHDRFFKETFSQSDVLIAFLNVFAPEEIRERFDYTTLTREVDTFTDEQLAEHFADVVRRLVATPAGQRFVGTGFLYLSYTSSLTKVELFGIFSRISSQTDTTAMTVAEELLQEGRQQAMTAAEELLRQQKVKFINAMLKLNIDAPTIALASELPLAEVNTIIDEINTTGAV